MKPNVKFKSAVRNSFVYFQLGLIAIMVVVLFVLEFKFENKTAKKDVREFAISKELPFVYNPIVSKIEKVLVKEKVSVVKPKLTNSFKKVDDKIEVKTIVETKSEVVVESENKSEVSTPEKEQSTETNVFKGEHTAFTVEVLPMFEACKGLKRDEQKDCFDSELAKAVFKNVKYPQNDFDNGKQGTALVAFVIDENGNITNVKSIDNKRATYDMRLAAEKAVKKLPKIIPAKQGKENVRIKYLLPITFKIN